MKKSGILLSVALCLILAATAFGGDKVKRVKGQTVFAPTIWSDYSYTKGGTLVTQLLVGRLVIRNRDPENSIIVTSIEFYGPDGELVTDFLESGEQILGPLASWSWTSSQSGVPPYDTSIPGRPCFIVEWEADNAVYAPSIGVGMVSVVIHGLDGAMDITSFATVAGSVIKD